MEPRNRLSEASRARHAETGEKGRGEEENESVPRIEEEIVAEIRSKIGSKAE